MTNDPDTLPVTVTIGRVEPVRGAGQLVGLAIAEIDVAGIVLTLQGVQVLRERDGTLSIRAPQFRSATGAWRSAVVLPDTLRDAIGAEVLAALTPRAA